MDSESTNCELVWPDTFSFQRFPLPLFTSVTSTFCLYLASFLSERVFTATAVLLLSNCRKFLVLTDSCSLRYIQDLKLSSSPKLTRYSLLLQHYNFHVKHLRGCVSILSDFLSRYPSIHSSQEELAEGQAKTQITQLTFGPKLIFMTIWAL
jgi:hypothetical protein